MSKIIVVGANHAGTAAINTILSENGNNEVVVFDKNSNISFLGCGMALWIGNQISKPDGLFYTNEGDLSKKGAKVHMETEVTDIDYANKTVTAKNRSGEIIKENYDKLILATGSIPIIPDVPGKNLENVQQVKLFQNAQEVIRKLGKPNIKKVTVIGAGYIGVELVEAFERNGKEVTLIDVMDICIPNYYDRPFTEMMRENLEEHNIKQVYGERVIEIQGRGKVEKVVTDKNVYETDMVIFCIGFRPNNALGKGVLEEFKNGAYVVNDKQETSIKDVYAVGDSATVFDNALGEKSYIALATNAVRSGIIAGSNVVGKPWEHIGVQGSNGICIYDLKMVSTGITLERASKLGIPAEAVDFEDVQKADFIEEINHKVKLRIVYNSKTRVVIGAQMASKHDMSMGIHMFSLAIQEKLTIDKLKMLDTFFLPHFNKPYNYITMAAMQA